MNNYVNKQAQQQVNQIQNYVEQVQGQPIRVYPFKIVSGLNYLSNRGLSSIGTNPGNTYPTNQQDANTNIPYGVFTDLSLIYSGNKPLIAYWFGVTNALCNSDGTITQTINATMDEQGNWVPNTFANPLTAQEIDDSIVGKDKWVNCEQQNPWKNVGVIDYSYAPNHTYTHQLDNVECGVYEMVYNYSCISNEWCPTFQEINEFIYYIIDLRYPCPLALRISAVSPHYRPDGVFEWADIQFVSINQYFNTSSYSILSYVHFAAPNDAYAFPQEIIIDGELKTIINPQLLLNSMGGVDSVCIKNNSLVAHLGTLIYGRPYTPYLSSNGVLTRVLEPDRYLLPLNFEAPINDNIVSKHSLVHSSYCLAMDMLIISQQLWGSWKQTKEIYNPIQNFTFQGGLAFAGGDNKTNSALYSSINKILNPNNEPTLTNQIMKDLSPTQTGFMNWGSCNLENVMLSNRSNYPLDVLDNQVWQPINSSNKGVGFWLVGDLMTWDFRFSKLVWGIADSELQMLYNPINGVNNALNNLTDIFDLGYEPNTTATSELGFISALANYPSAFISPTTAFILNSLSMKQTHMLEVNYRDGIVYTNTNRGHGGFLNMIANWMSSIADKIQGYTPGVAEFFMNTAARTYNLFIPSSLLPLFQQYLDPSADNYNAVPLDIFNNSYDNNTAVGQLQYMSGLQFSLTDWYQNVDGLPFTTASWSKFSLPANQSDWKQINNLNVPNNSFSFFAQSIPSPTATSYIIDSINVKELGQSNIHVSYLKKNAKGKLEKVGEQWCANNAKVMKNNAYIENDFDYYVYDEYNTSFASNVSPYFALNYGPLPSIVNTNQNPYSLGSSSRGSYGIVADAQIQGIVINSVDTKEFLNVNDYMWTYPSLTCEYQGGVSVLNTPYSFTDTLNNGVPTDFKYSFNGNWFSANPVTIPSTIDNTGYLDLCNSSNHCVVSGYLSATEKIINSVISYYSIINNDFYNGFYYIEAHQLIFNIKFFLQSIQDNWEYKKNDNYKNIICLVPSDYTSSQIDSIPIPSTLPQQDFIGFYDGSKFVCIGTSSTIDNIDYFKVDNYITPSTPKDWTVDMKVASYLNSGGVVYANTINQPYLATANSYQTTFSTVNIGDKTYSDNDSNWINNPIQSTPEVSSTPNAKYGKKLFKVVMIVLK